MNEGNNHDYVLITAASPQSEYSERESSSLLRSENVDFIQPFSTNSPIRVIGYYNEFDDIRKNQLSKLTHAIVALSNKIVFGFSTIIFSKFVDSIVSFIAEHQIDGVNIFWETPAESKFRYSEFLATLREKLSEQGRTDDKQYVISIVVPRRRLSGWGSGFDLDSIIDNVDFINVFSMNYYGPLPDEWGHKVWPSAPLFCENDRPKEFSVDYTMRYYIEETRQSGIFNLVIPFYVRLWKNVGEKLKESEVYRDVELKVGKVEGEPYMDRWTAEHEGWKLTPASWDEKTKTSYIYNPEAKTFLTFEDERSLAQKMQYVNEKNLGGVWIWSVHTDDEEGTLLNSLVKNNRFSQVGDNNYTGSQPNSSTSRRDTSPTQLACGKRVIGYYSEFESVDITKHQISKLTHAVFAYVEMTHEGKLKFKTEMAKNRFMSLKYKSRSVKSDVKVMISIGGYENSQHFSSVTEDSEKKTVFINSIVSFLKEHKIHGIDLYWKGATENDKWKYIEFVRELRQKLIGTEDKPYLISLTLPAPKIENWEMAYDLEESLNDVDFFNVYAMDYHGPWDNQWGTPAGPIAPLYSTLDSRKQFSVDSTMKYFVYKTKQPSRFNIVIPFFARLWRNVKEAVEPGQEIIRKAELTNNKAVGNPYMSRWTVADQKWELTPATWDEESKSSYIYNPQTKNYLTFEDEKSIAAKIDYVNKSNLGGVWIWTIDMDDDKNSLINMVKHQ
ncbi:hypothetical protein CRE_01672 [Caenorhabditis remanei]|uniref:GH18 domain-containing protein n=1 Tax=Caenorhabditis remanei TaxID=31234 RepID=E3LH39_CAERE|nr:hypothetical protein CRE_01672 [Caenorhabditis remanei]